MANIINGDNGVLSGTAGLKSSSDGTGILALQTNGTTAVTVDASQNVGVGTASPAAKLDVAGGINTTQNITTGNGAAFVFGTATTAYMSGSSTSNNLTYFTASTERMRIDSSGNVGIGQSSITQAFTNYTQLNISGSSGATIQMQSGSTTRANIVSDSNALYIAQLSGNMQFAVGGTGTGTNRMTIASNGQMSTTNGAGVVALAYDCRAWVNFNGTGTVAIRASGNVTSITDNGVGNYTINLTTAMPDVNYCCSGTCEGNGETISVSTKTGRTTSAIPLIVVKFSGGANVQTDNADVDISVHR